MTTMWYADGWGTHGGADWTWLALVFMLVTVMVATLVVVKLRNHH